MMTKMSRRTVFAGLAAMAGGTAYPQAQSADALMLASHEVSRFSQARFRARLSIAASGRPTRLRDIVGVSKVFDAGRAMARRMSVTGPADMRGVATLTVDRKQAADDLWVYLPSLRRVRRLVTSNRRDPWMGSDFSYGDVVGHEVADWHHRVLRRETVAGAACTVVVSTPRTDTVASETGYSRRLTWVRDSDAFAVQVDFFDLAGGFLKSMMASDIRLVDAPAGKSQAMKILMRTAKSESALAFDEFKVAADVSDSEVAPESLGQ